jgi:hypothetical protein
VVSTRNFKAISLRVWVFLLDLAGKVVWQFIYELNELRNFVVGKLSLTGSTT